MFSVVNCPDLIWMCAVVMPMPCFFLRPDIHVHVHVVVHMYIYMYMYIVYEITHAFTVHTIVGNCSLSLVLSAPNKSYIYRHMCMYIHVHVKGKNHK